MNRNPLNLGTSTDEEIMNYFNEEKYETWKNRTYKSDETLLEKFETITNKPAIVVIGDYDVDGIMSTKLMTDLLRILHPESDVSYILPRRFSDGYGISENIAKAVLSEFKPQDTCIVTVDNGISQFKALNLLFERGYSIVLTDHHEPQRREDGSLILPLADCIINPHIGGFTFEHYCGAGVVYQLAKHLIPDSQIIQRRFLPYAAIATIADVVPLVEDNWVMARELLGDAETLLPTELNFTKKPAKFIDEGDIGFVIVPTLNAAGRLLDDGAGRVLDYLFHPTYAAANELRALNETRKELVVEQTGLVMQYIEENNLGKLEPICVNVPGLHHGVVGIIAGKVCEKYQRACLICSDGRGSGRSPKRFDLFKFCASHAELFEKFGGHEGACGFSITEENLKALAAFANPVEVASEKHYDIRLGKEEITEFYAKTKQFRPFGQDNPAPKCMVSIRGTDTVKYMGKDANGNPAPIHLSIENTDGSKIVHFNHRNPATGCSGLADDNCFDGIGKVELNYFRNTAIPQLNLEEVYDPEEPPLDLSRLRL